MTEKYKISSNKEDTARRLLSHNKERNNAICIIGPRDYHTKWIKSDRQRQISWYHLSVESKVWYKWAYLQFRNRLTDTENKMVVTKIGEAGKRWNWEGILATVVDILVIWVNLSISVHFSLLIPKMSIFTLTISFDHFQFTSMHVPNILGSYEVFFFFIASDFASTTRRIQNWRCFHFCWASSFLLELLLHSSPVTYWAPTDLGSTVQ